MRKLTLLLLLISLPIFGQKVGINTDNPQETLHVDGTLRVDSLPNMPSATKVLVADDNNKIGQSTFQDVYTKYDYTYDTVYSLNSANNPGAYSAFVDVGNVNYVEFVDLPMTRTVTIPDGVNYILEIDYDMPMGIILDIHDVITGYMGVMLYVNGNLIPEGCAKNSLPLDVTVDNSGSQTDYASYRCMRVSEHFMFKGTEIANGSDTTLTIELKGYIEQHSVISDGLYVEYKWGGWAVTYYPNYNNWNWGRGSLDVRVREQ